MAPLISTFINDILSTSGLLYFLLVVVDDRATNSFASHKSYDTLFQLMKQELYQVNKLSLNISKAQFIGYYLDLMADVYYQQMQKLFIDNVLIT